MKVAVQTASHHYDVIIGKTILAQAFAERTAQLQQADKIMVFTDEHVWQAQGDYFKESFPFAYEVFIFPGGEASKTFEQYNAAQTFMLQQQGTRKSLIIAFGGGAVGDAAGFVAATYMRGIDFIQVPTTILAHDSAVGGKTAINHPLGKNMIGAFHQPQAVLYDTAMLASLPQREIRSGMAEVIKHAYLSDPQWVAEILPQNILAIADDTLANYLYKGIQVKANIVSQDETEQSVRKYLNLGHTYGHAIEAAAGYGKIAHGEAVVIGLLFTLLLSERYGTISRQQTMDFIAYAKRNNYPLQAVKDYTFEQLQGYLLKDKKALYGELQFVLLKQIGEPFVQQIALAECQEIDELLRSLVD